MSKFYFVVTFGCQMNVHESEKVAGILEDMGYQLADAPENADIVVFNTCCIRDTAEKRALGNIGALKKQKLEKGTMLVVLGCMTEQKGYTEVFKEKYPFVDIVMGTKNLPLLKEKIEQRLRVKKRVFDTVVPENFLDVDEKTPVCRTSFPNAWINIMYGCDNFCSYCIVPHVRGREISRDPEKIIAEARRVVSEGYKEITLLGQNVNSYKGILNPATTEKTFSNSVENSTENPQAILENSVGNQHDNLFENQAQSTRTATDTLQISPESIQASSEIAPQTVNFAWILKEIDKIEGDFRIRFMTSHPKDLTEEIVDVIKNSKKICNNIHLPVQSGSNNVLLEMNRKYTREHYLSLIKMIREKLGDSVGITSDIMVGFPGETEQDFLDTCDLVEKARFSSAFTFIYSVRKGTKAEKMPQIPYEIKKRRIGELIKIQNRITRELSDGYVGGVYEVLIEDVSPKYANSVCGRTESGRLVTAQGTSELIGKFADIKITAAKSASLIGEIVKIR